MANTKSAKKKTRVIARRTEIGNVWVYDPTSGTGPGASSRGGWML